jgi:hypothetical protein
LVVSVRHPRPVRVRARPDVTLAVKVTDVSWWADDADAVRVVLVVTRAVATPGATGRIRLAAATTAQHASTRWNKRMMDPRWMAAVTLPSSAGPVNLNPDKYPNNGGR